MLKIMKIEFFKNTSSYIASAARFFGLALNFLKILFSFIFFHCFLADGQVLWGKNQHPMTYNINQLKNDSFIAMNKPLKKRVVV